MGTKSRIFPRSYLGRRVNRISVNGQFVVDELAWTTFKKDDVYTRTGVPNPLWRWQIRGVNNASTPFTAFKEKTEWKSTNLTLTYSHIDSASPNRDLTVVHHSDFGLLTFYPPAGVDDTAEPVVQPVDSSEVELRAITALYRQIRELNHQLQGGVVLGEIRKTMQMLARPAKALREGLSKYLKSTRKGRRGVPGPSFPKLVADTYLEYTFGWQPLLHDCRDAAIALAKHHLANPPVRFRVFERGESVSNHLIDFAHPAVGTLLFDAHRKDSGLYAVIYYGAFQDSASAALPESSLQRVISLSGFDLASFIPTVWELLPYSFLVDYFINIGDVLLAATTDTSKVKWLTKVVIEERKREVTLSVNTKATMAAFTKDHFGISLSGGSGGYTTFKRSVSRSPLANVPNVGLSLRAPDLFGKQMLNIVGLLLSKIA